MNISREVLVRPSSPTSSSVLTKKCMPSSKSSSS
jgi:hypothetical protein